VTRPALLAVALLAGASFAHPAHASEGSADLRPVQLVRSLQLVQDRVAAGDHAALPMQKKLLEMIDRRFREGTVAELSEPDNFRAALVYAMSGGNPATLEIVMSRVELGEQDSRRALGVLTYLSGGTKAAIVALRPIDPMQEPSDLGAFIALVKGSLSVIDNPKAALQLFDEARLLSPGTLVEEAALRRSLPIIAGLGDKDRFLLAAEQYIRAYLRSPYASQFADALVAGIIALQDTIDLDRVDEVVGLMTPEQRHVIYLRIARRAAIDNIARLSQYAAERTGLAEAGIEGATEDPRALLYSSLAEVATGDPEQIAATLTRIDREQLSAGDRKLLDAVAALNDQITKATETPEPEPAPDTAAEAAEVEAPAAPAPAPEVEPPLPAAAENLANGETAASTADATADAAAEAPAEPPAEVPVRRVRTVTTDASAQLPAEQAAAEPVAPQAETAAADSQDPADLAIASSRKKLDEIDALLAKAKK